MKNIVSRERLLWLLINLVGQLWGIFQLKNRKYLIFNYLRFVKVTPQGFKPWTFRTGI